MLKLLFLVQFETGGGVAFGVVKLAGHGVSFDGAGDTARLLAVLVVFLKFEGAVGFQGAGDVECWRVEFGVADSTEDAVAFLLQTDGGGSYNFSFVCAGDRRCVRRFFLCLRYLLCSVLFFHSGSRCVGLSLLRILHVSLGDRIRRGSRGANALV